jgi:hypothetical protein
MTEAQRLQIQKQVFAAIPSTTDTDSRRVFCHVAIEAIIEVLKQHTKGDLEEMMKGYLLITQEGVAQIIESSNSPRTNKPLDS